MTVNIYCGQGSNDLMAILVRSLRLPRWPFLVLVPIVLYLPIAVCLLPIAVFLMWTSSSAAGDSLRPQASSATIGRCQAAQGETAQLPCFEYAGSQNAPQEQPSKAETWRLLRTPNPAGGRDAVSIVQTADIAGSDLEFAGLMLRCNDTSIEVLVVLVRPLPPHSHPTVEFEAGSKRVQFTANVVTPGALLLLPPETTGLAVSSWQELPKLSITVEHEHGPIHGVVSLTGLANALQVLRSNCQIP
jgi:hypothetical protein